jgi:succinate dehydrogenase hydrophobic anchor subunit
MNFEAFVVGMMGLVLGSWAFSQDAIKPDKQNKLVYVVCGVAVIVCFWGAVFNP